MDNNKPDWLPTGCGTYINWPAEVKRGKEPEFPQDLAGKLASADLGIEEIYLAWELTRMAGPGLDQLQQRVLIVLILTLRLAALEGSTRLALEEGKLLSHSLDEIGVEADERAILCNLLDLAKEICSRKDQSGSSPLEILFGPADSYTPLIIDHDCLYMQKLHVLEKRVGCNLLKRINDSFCTKEISENGISPYTKRIEDALTAVLSKPAVSDSGKEILLDEEQQQAIRTALSGRISIISGRPGSGKTSIVAGILRVLARLGVPSLEAIALAAPTGKAADRMRQAITAHLSSIAMPDQKDIHLETYCPPATTLHRLLAYSPKRDKFLHNEHNPLSEELVIVDESSMIDLAMMDNLLRALKADARVILLGDADQLPSIEAGAVLRDLCRAECIYTKNRVVMLKQSYRAREEDPAGKSILDGAAAINAGTAPDKWTRGLPAQVRNSTEELGFYGLEILRPGSEEQQLSFLELWFALLIKDLPDKRILLDNSFSHGPEGFQGSAISDLKKIFSHYEKRRLLCATRITAGKTGSDSINDWLHNRWARHTLKDSSRAWQRFLVGEPVMVTRNDYNLRLYNGDSGLILKISPSYGARKLAEEPMAVFPREESFVAFPPDALHGRLELAWASTVHKAQGSEFENVAVMLPEKPVRTLTRELLYTAVTRAKKSVVIIGSKETLEKGIARSMERESGLADLFE